MDVDQSNGIGSPQSPIQSPGRPPSHPNPPSPPSRPRRELPAHPRLTRSRLREGLIGSGRRVSSIQEVLNIDEGGHREADDILRGIGGFSESNSLPTTALQNAALGNDIEEMHRAGEDRKRRHLEERRRRRAQQRPRQSSAQSAVSAASAVSAVARQETPTGREALNE